MTRGRGGGEKTGIWAMAGTEEGHTANCCRRGVRVRYRRCTIIPKYQRGRRLAPCALTAAETCAVLASLRLAPEGPSLPSPMGSPSTPIVRPIGRRPTPTQPRPLPPSTRPITGIPCYKLSGLRRSGKDAARNINPGGHKPTKRDEWDSVHMERGDHTEGVQTLNSPRGC